MTSDTVACPPPPSEDAPVSALQARRRIERVYVCHPFAGDVSANVGRVRAICRAMAENGLLPVAPHLYLPQFVDEETQRDRALEFCLSLVEVCSQVQVFGGHMSPGMRLEIECARALGIPVCFVELGVG